MLATRQLVFNLCDPVQRRRAYAAMETGLWRITFDETDITGGAFNSAWSIPIARAAVRIALRTHGSLLARRQV